MGLKSLATWQVGQEHEWIWAWTTGVLKVIIDVVDAVDSRATMALGCEDYEGVRRSGRSKIPPVF